jgi:hypothetical protein
MGYRNGSAVSIGAIAEEAHLSHHDFLFTMDFTEAAEQCRVAIGIPGIAFPAGQLVQHHDRGREAFGHPSTRQSGEGTDGVQPQPTGRNGQVIHTERLDW